MKTIDVLKGMRQVLDNPESWIQGRLACDQYGVKARPQEPAACKFCLYGAMAKVVVDMDNEAANQADLILREVCMDNIADFNDNMHTKHRDVLRVLDEAIAKCEPSISSESLK